MDVVHGIDLIDTTWDVEFEAVPRPTGPFVIAKIHRMPRSARPDELTHITFEQPDGTYGRLSSAHAFDERPQGLRGGLPIPVSNLSSWLSRVCPTSADLGSIADVEEDCRNDEAGRPIMVETEHACSHCDTLFRERTHMPAPAPCPLCGTISGIVGSLYIGPQHPVIQQLYTDHVRQSCLRLTQ